jgi:hypothetical protein
MLGQPSTSEFYPSPSHVIFIYSSVAEYKLSFEETRLADFSQASRPFLNRDARLFWS